MHRESDCQACPSARVCPWAALDQADREALERIMRRPIVLRKGKELFRVGQPLRGLHIVRSGCVKAWNVTESGEEYVLRFYMAGDVVGLGAIADGRYDCNATALDTSSICELPFRDFQRAAELRPALNHVLLRLMSREILQEERLSLLKGNKSASARIAGFLCHLADGFDQRGFSSQEFNLAMGRREIAEFLGLALETVCRTLTQFGQQGMIEVEGRHIVLHDRDRLNALAHASAGGAVVH
ncbi:MAG TPA: cyclic nucleotide-binding domain-containing protein [Chromatiales bacterium]|nr:cyclic nucleotide-binding domain-containing protein [Chromatiales bacterium]